MKNALGQSSIGGGGEVMFAATQDRGTVPFESAT